MKAKLMVITRKILICWMVMLSALLMTAVSALLVRVACSAAGTGGIGLLPLSNTVVTQADDHLCRIVEDAALESAGLASVLPKVEIPAMLELKDSNVPVETESAAIAAAEEFGPIDAPIQPEWQTQRMRVTAYCPCPLCCGKYAAGITANGHSIQPGEKFAAADKNFAFGTELVVPGYNQSEPIKVIDRGGAIKGNKLDVFFASHKDALEWGVQYLDVKVKVR